MGRHLTESAAPLIYQSLDAASKLFGQGATLWVYGHSYTVGPGLNCTPGREQFNRLVRRQQMSHAMTFGLSSLRLGELAQSLIGNGTTTGWANWNLSSKWSGTRKGVVLVDCVANDMFHSLTNFDTSANALGTNGQKMYEHCLRTTLAVLSSSSRVEPPAPPANWSLTSSAIYSSGSNIFTQTQNAPLDVSVTVPSSGTLYALIYSYRPAPGNGSVSFSIGGTTYATLSSASLPSVFWGSRASGAGTEYIQYPAVVKITGLPTGAQTITVKKTDSGSSYVFFDCFLVPSSSPPPVLILKDPLWNATLSGSSSYYSTLTSNKTLLDSTIDSVCAEFSNAIVVDPGLNPTTDLGSDGIHPNDRGMRKQTDAIVAALSKYASDPDDTYNTTLVSPTSQISSVGLSSTPAASTVANTWPISVIVYIVGGAVSSISQNGVATGQITGTFVVPAGHSLSITYTIAPTLAVIPLST